MIPITKYETIVSMTTAHKRTQHYALIGVIAIVSLLGGWWFSQKILNLQGTADIPQGLEATVLPQARPLKPFILVDQDNQKFDLQRLHGRWSFLFFGFTRCPDVCPTTLHTMKGVRKILQQQPNQDMKLQMVFVSVDPNRDSPEILKKYVTYFDPTFLGVTGELQHITELTRQLGILYEYHNNSDDKQAYTVNHSAQILLVDPLARLRAVLSSPHDANTIAENFLAIEKFYGS